MLYKRSVRCLDLQRSKKKLATQRNNATDSLDVIKEIGDSSATRKRWDTVHTVWIMRLLRLSSLSVSSLTSITSICVCKSSMQACLHFQAKGSPVLLHYHDIDMDMFCEESSFLDL